MRSGTFGVARSGVVGSAGVLGSGVVLLGVVLLGVILPHRCRYETKKKKNGYRYDAVRVRKQNAIVYCNCALSTATLSVHLNELRIQ